MLKQISKTPMKVTVNYYKFKTTGNFYKYQIMCDPEIDDQDEELFKKVLRLCIPLLKENFKKFSVANRLVFYTSYFVEDFSFNIDL